MSDFDPTAPVNAIITGQINAKQAREEQKRQHRYNKELMKLSYGYGQAEQQNSALNTKIGYMLAGMSPALASEGMFAPAGGASPLPSSAAPSRYPKFESGASLSGLLQLDNIKAQTDNLKAQTKNTEIKNEQEQNANEVSDFLADVYFDKMAASAHSEEEAKAYENLKSIAKNKGAFGLLENYLDTMDKRELYNAHYQEYLLKRDLAFYQRTNGQLFMNLAKMPNKQFEQIDAQIKVYLEEAKKLAADKSLTDEERNLKLQQIKLTKEQIENLKAATKNLENTNIMKMIDEEQYGKAFIAVILMLLGNVSVSGSHKF